MLVHAKKAAEKSRRFIDNIESKKQSSISRAKSIPENATIRKELSNVERYYAIMENTARITMPTGKILKQRS